MTQFSVLGTPHKDTCMCDGCYGARIQRTPEKKLSAEDKADERYHKARK